MREQLKQLLNNQRAAANHELGVLLVELSKKPKLAVTPGEPNPARTLGERKPETTAQKSEGRGKP